MDSNKNILKEKEKELFSTKIKVPKNKIINKSVQNKEITNIENNNYENIKFVKSNSFLEIERNIKRAELLDKEFFYNDKFQKFSLEIYYVSDKENIKTTAKYIKEKLSKKGINIKLLEISTKDLN
jgi:hypothetical protein